MYEKIATPKVASKKCHVEFYYTKTNNCSDCGIYQMLGRHDIEVTRCEKQAYLVINKIEAFKYKRPVEVPKAWEHATTNTDPEIPDLKQLI